MMQKKTDPALMELTPCADAVAQMRAALEELARADQLNPEAGALRTLLMRADVAREHRDVRADEGNQWEREIQFLVDMRAAIDVSLENAVPWAQKREGVTWQRLGDLLGTSRQGAHERYAYRAN